MNLNEFINGRFPDIFDGDIKNWSGNVVSNFKENKQKEK